MRIVPAAFVHAAAIPVCAPAAARLRIYDRHTIGREVMTERSQREVELAEEEGRQSSKTVIHFHRCTYLSAPSLSEVDPWAVGHDWSSRQSRLKIPPASAEMCAPP